MKRIPAFLALPRPVWRMNTLEDGHLRARDIAQRALGEFEEPPSHKWVGWAPLTKMGNSF